MKAKCVFCLNGEKPCTHCKDTGYMDVGFAEGNLWTRACTDPTCGFENGGRIEKGDKEPSDSPGECVICHKPAKWMLVGDMCDVMQQ